MSFNDNQYNLKGTYINIDLHYSKNNSNLYLEIFLINLQFLLEIIVTKQDLQINILSEYCSFTISIAYSP